jgi:hypothetical protein
VRYAELVQAWKALRGRIGGLSVREVALVGAARTMLVAELAPDGPPTAVPAVAFAAGVHGDEPAAPWALHSLVRDGLLDRSFNYRFWPCTNPSGYELGTRENADGVDINRSFNRGGTTPEARTIVTANRDRKFALSFDMHEDYEAEGFYCYEPVVNGRAPFGAQIVRALDDAGLPVQEFRQGFDLAYPPEARPRLERGRVQNAAEDEIGPEEGRPYSPFMLRHAAERTLTLESPRSRPWDERIAIHRVAVTTALAALRNALHDAESSR